MFSLISSYVNCAINIEINEEELSSEQINWNFFISRQPFNHQNLILYLALIDLLLEIIIVLHLLPLKLWQNGHQKHITHSIFMALLALENSFTACHCQ